MGTGATMRAAAAVIGVGESAYYRHGRSPVDEFSLCLDAVRAACGDAGIRPADLDGFVSFSDDRNSSVRLATSLGVRELRWSTMQWGGGGGGSAGAVQQAAAAVHCGFADCVVVYRGITQGRHGRYSQGAATRRWSSHFVPYGHLTAANFFALNATRFFHETGIDPGVQRSVVLASYAHAQRNPRAVMHGRPLTAQAYDDSRWIVEPFHLYDCCQESDGAAALIIVSADRARATRPDPVYLLGCVQGAGHRGGGVIDGVFDSETLGTAEFRTVAPRLYAMAGVTPADIDVVQGYENFAAGVVMALIEHGFCEPDQANEFFVPETFLAPGGRLPLNTSGGNLAEGYLHGMGHHIEAVRQLRGTSVNQVPDAQLSLVFAGPMVTPTSSAIYGSEATL
ncbi:lipid-transfer protein [Dactylosporangium sp. NPDC050688]|uniref:thiolase C-terminal domain-containing protein n=1 Tax=Dactylosporangium sp. NPDC050688 TaxID=3157217 RepID=UPI0033DEDA19